MRGCRACCDLTAGAAALSVCIDESGQDFCKIFVNSCVLSYVKTSGKMSTMI